MQCLSANLGASINRQTVQVDSKKDAERLVEELKLTMGENSIAILRIQKTSTLRLLAEEEAATGADTANLVGATNGKKVFVKPAAVFGIILSLALGLTLWIGVYCMLFVEGPANFATKEFKFGREM